MLKWLIISHSFTFGLDGISYGYDYEYDAVDIYDYVSHGWNYQCKFEKVHIWYLVKSQGNSYVQA